MNVLSEETLDRRERKLMMESSLCEKPERQGSRRLADYLKLNEERKVHSLIDKVYHQTNLRLAWKRVKANKGAGGIDGITITKFEEDLEKHLESMQISLKDNTYTSHPVLRVKIPKRDDPRKTRNLGIPRIYDRVVQQALVNRLEPIFEKLFDESSFGYRKGRRQRDALSKIWREIEQGNEWLVDAGLKDYFGSIDQQKLMTLVSQRIADGRVLRLIEQMLKAGYVEENRLFPSEVGTIQGGVISPLLSNVLLTPFDKEMRCKGYRLTRWADDWVVTCKSRAEAEQVLKAAKGILEKLGVTINTKKTRIVHVSQGFEFLGFKIGRGKRKFYLPEAKIKSKLRSSNLYAIPADRSLKRFQEAVRQKTQRKIPLQSQQIIEELNPLIRGWGEYYKRSNVRRIFNVLDRWIIRRIWSHRYKRWRCAGWKTLPNSKLREMGLVSLVSMIPSLQAKKAHS